MSSASTRMLIETLSNHLKDKRLRGSRGGEGDRDYSGGSNFSWQETELVLFRSQRYRRSEVTHTRVSVSGYSQETTSPAQQDAGSWSVEAAPNDRINLVFRSDAGAITRLLVTTVRGSRGTAFRLNGRTYSVSEL